VARALVGGGFAIFVMDELYLLAAARYIKLNPVRAQLTAHPADFRWSSARAHLSGQDDALVKAAPLLGFVSDWRVLLESGMEEGETKLLRRHERTGRTLGSERFLKRVEDSVGRILRRGKPGPKRALSMNSSMVPRPKTPRIW
jgi:putative transposase